VTDFVVLAHAGHWLVDFAIYLGPAVVILALLKLGDWRREREEGGRERSLEGRD
jgi:hypothetical protein